MAWGEAPNILGVKSCKAVRKGLVWPATESEQVDLILAAILRSKARSVIIEDFILRLPVRSMARDGLSSCRIGFGLYRELVGRSIPVVWQQPVEMAVIKAEEARLALGKNEHQRDAIKHLLVHWRKAGMTRLV